MKRRHVGLPVDVEQGPSQGARAGEKSRHRCQFLRGFIPPQGKIWRGEPETPSLGPRHHSAVEREARRTVVGGRAKIVSPSDVADARPLEALLMDVDAIEGKVTRPNECNPDKTDQMPIANVIRGHGGLITGHRKGFAGLIPL